MTNQHPTLTDGPFAGQLNIEPWHEDYPDPEYARIFAEAVEVLQSADEIITLAEVKGESPQDLARELLFAVWGPHNFWATDNSRPKPMSDSYYSGLMEKLGDASVMRNRQMMLKAAMSKSPIEYDGTVAGLIAVLKTLPEDWETPFT